MYERLLKKREITSDEPGKRLGIKFPYIRPVICRRLPSRLNVAVGTLSLAVHLPLSDRTGNLYPLDYAHIGRTKRREPRRLLSRALSVKKAASYSPALHCSTIGAGGLNFSVRNGKRWDPAAITT